MRTRYLRALFVPLLLSYCGNVAASVTCPSGGPPSLEGTIAPGDFAATIKCLEAFVSRGLPNVRAVNEFDTDNADARAVHLRPVGWFYLDSEGGDVNEAIKLGRFLRESLGEVVVSNKCLSSCFLAAVGAVKLLAGSPFGQLGIHRIYYPAAGLADASPAEYERLYNEIKRGMRAYLQDMDVPTSLADRLFNVPSDEIHILSTAEIAELDSHPAFDEWVAAKCPRTLSKGEEIDWGSYVSAGFRSNTLSEGYIDYLRRASKARESCIDEARWAQFTATVRKYAALR